MNVKLKSLVFILAATLVCGSAYAQVPGATADTVKLVILDNKEALGARDSSVAIQILISIDSAITGGSFGFSWSDTANWGYDSVTFGPVLVAHFGTFVTSDVLVDSLGKVLLGWVDFAVNPIPAAADMEWGTIYFSLKPGNDWAAGKVMTIDSSFVPPAGDWVMTYNGGTDVSPNFLGAKVVTYSDVVIGEGGALPRTFEISQNYPNPFNPSTKIEYQVPTKSKVQLEVFNVLGQIVTTLVDGDREAGRYQVTWNGINDNGAQVASGMYFYKITAGDFVQTRKMMLMK